MVWFADTTVSLYMVLQQQLKLLRRQAIAFRDNVAVDTIPSVAVSVPENQFGFVEAIAHYFQANPSIIQIMLEFSVAQSHIMEPTVDRLLGAFYSLLVRGLSLVAEYNDINADFQLSAIQLESFSTKWLLYSLLWGFGGSMTWERREALGTMLVKHGGVDLPNGRNIIDLQVSLPDGTWTEWAASVPKTEIEPHRVTASDVVVTTTDTVRHTEVLRAWLESHKPLLLCGPPGSGKTMTLTSVIETSSDYVLASLNFSSGTTPDLIIKTFTQYCETVDSPEGLVLQVLSLGIHSYFILIIK